MSYTKADMKDIFRRGVMFGLCWTPEGDTVAAANEITSSFFENALKRLREEKQPAKPKTIDTAKEIEAWRKAGKPKGWGVIEGFEDFF